MLECTLVSPTESVSVQQASYVSVRATNGDLGFLPGHVPAVARLVDASGVRIVTGEGERTFRVGADTFLRIEKDVITVLTASIEEVSR